MTAVRSTLTDSVGFFALDSLRPGLHLLDISHPDSPAQRLPVLVPAGEAGEIALTFGDVSPDEQEAVDLVLHDPERLRGLRALERRRQAGAGFFATRGQLLEEIYYVGEVLLIAPRIGGRRVMSGRIPEFVLRRGARTCQPALFADGRRYLHPGGLTDFMGQEVIAAELHLDRVPAELKTFDTTANCGVLSIWTRLGKGRPEAA